MTCGTTTSSSTPACCIRFDFEDTVWGFRAHDIAMAMLDLLEDTDETRYAKLLAAFRRGYQAHLAWPDDRIEPFQIGRLLWKINWVALSPAPAIDDHGRTSYPGIRALRTDRTGPSPSIRIVRIASERCDARGEPCDSSSAIREGHHSTTAGLSTQRLAERILDLLTEARFGARIV